MGKTLELPPVVLTADSAAARAALGWGIHSRQQPPLGGSGWLRCWPRLTSASEAEAAAACSFFLETWERVERDRDYRLGLRGVGVGWEKLSPENFSWAAGDFSRPAKFQLQLKRGSISVYIWISQAISCWLLLASKIKYLSFHLIQQLSP